MWRLRRSLGQACSPIAPFWRDAGCLMEVVTGFWNIVFVALAPSEALAQPLLQPCPSSTLRRGTDPGVCSSTPHPETPDLTEVWRALSSPDARCMFVQRRDSPDCTRHSSGSRWAVAGEAAQSPWQEHAHGQQYPMQHQQYQPAGPRYGQHGPSPPTQRVPQPQQAPNFLFGGRLATVSASGRRGRRLPSCRTWCCGQRGLPASPAHLLIACAVAHCCRHPQPQRPDARVPAAHVSTAQRCSIKHAACAHILPGRA